MSADSPGRSQPSPTHPDPEEPPVEDLSPTPEITDEDHGTAGGRERRRPVDATSLVAGLVVLVIAAAFAFGDPDTVRDQGRIIGPVALLGIGAALLIGSLDR